MSNNNKFLVPGLLLSLAIPAGALTFNLSNKQIADGTLQSRSERQALSIKGIRSVPGRIARTAKYAGDEIAEVDKLGTLRLVMEEDFSKMSTGTIEEPDCETKMEIPMNSEEYEYPYWNLKPEFTTLPHWGVGAESPGSYGMAGGCYYMEMIENERGGCTQAKINTPTLKVDEDGAIAVLEFKARTRNKGETYDWLMVEVGETNNMGPTWRIVDDYVIVSEIPDTWTTYRLIFREGGPSTLFHLIGVGPGNVYLDDFKVYQLVPNVMYPEVLPHSEYKGTSFVANWAPVEDADSYLLSVYYEKEFNNGAVVKTYVMEDQPVTGTSYTVNDVESGETYYYTVRAVKGENQSLESFPMRVYDLETPVMNAPERLSNHEYKASWSAVPGADVYNYIAYNKRVATVDGPFVVTEENFDGITDSDGYKTGLTKEDPDEHTIVGKFYPTQLNQQGWYGESSMPYDDYIAFDAFWYSVGQGQSGFISPELDMSKDGGKFTVEADLAAGADWAGNITSCCVAIFNWDEAKGDYTQEELVYVDKELNINWQRCTFNMTKGTERSIIGIFAISSLDNLYLDNLKITQNYKAGESLLEPFRYVSFHGRLEKDDPTSIEIAVPGRVRDCEVYHQVSAFSRKPDRYNQSYDSRESAFSPLEFVFKSINAVDAIEVAPVDADAEYFTVDGIKVSPANVGNGIYIVRRGSQVTKEYRK